MDTTIQEFGICNLSLVPLRAEPSDRSEMVSQLLFGDHFQILEKNGKWLRIKTEYDHYEGWIDHKQYTALNWDDYHASNESPYILGLAVFHQVINLSTGETIRLLAGSGIPLVENNRFRMNKDFYKLDHAPIKPLGSSFLNQVSVYARFYLNTPYLWGGRSIFGIDCSGFTQIVFKQFGIRLLRDAWQQAEQGDLVSFLPEAISGDLAFFDNDEGRITHVGIMLDNSRIIHASGKVRIDSIDDQGIYNSELKRYTHNLRIIKRFNS